MKQLKDRVLEVSQTQGTGDYALAGAVTGFRAFSPAVNVGDTADYYAEEVDGTGVPSGAWETGMGTYAAGNKLQRTTIYASSNGGTPINWGVGTRRVAISLTSQTLADAVNSAEIASGYVAAANAAKVAAEAAATASSSSASASATSASQSSAARDAAIAAWAASTAPAEQLAAISQSIHSGTIVKAIIYDTSKDSDGGAWRKRCTDKSWYTETLGGDRWLGQQATIAAAWAAAGSAIGAVFQASATAGPLTSGKYYAATGATTATEVFRGISREFPAVAGIVAESIRVVIYDLTQPGCPMWMVFTGNNWGGSGTFFGTAYAGTSATSLCMLNGILLIGVNNGTPYVGGLSYVMFVKDSFGKIGYSTGSGGSGTEVTTRRFFAGYRLDRASLDFPVAIVNATVNDVAITILDNAPIDPATGLPTPTIAVATDGGVSVIKDDGTVVNWLSGSFGGIWSVSIDAKGGLLASGGAGVAWGSWMLDRIPESSTNTYDRAFHSGSTPARLGINGSNGQVLRSANVGQYRAFAVTDFGIHLLKENPATPSKGMVNYLNHLYTSGWQVGDIRRAWLADTVAGTVVGSDITPPDPANWVSVNGCTLTKSGSDFVMTKNGTQYYAEAYIPASVMVAGKKYEIQVTVVANANSQLLGIYQIGAGYLSTADAAPVGHVRTATAPTEGGNLGVVIVGAVDTSSVTLSITCKLAEADRSVKNSGIPVVGTLTKAPVASGAALMGYSGFSAGNYLQQAYSADLDFGTGDFCVMGWYRVSSLSNDCTLFYRGAGVPSYAPAAGFNIWAQGGAVKTQIGGVTLESNYSLRAAAWILISVMRVSGVVYIHADGVLIGSGSNTSNLSGAQISRIGAGYWSAPDHSLALWRISATAPSADQLAHIYRTELPLFQAGAQCTLVGTSNVVTALAYDDVADTLHVGTSYGRTSFRDLLRVDSEATTTGGTTSLSANQGAILTGGTSGKYYQPALLLRDELRRKDEARKAMGRVQVALDFTATSAQTAFVCTKGYDVRSVYANGLLKRVGTDYTISDDGFKKTVTFTAGQLVGVPVTAMLTRA